MSEKSPSVKRASDVEIVTEQLGVWRLRWSNDRFDPRKRFQDMVSVIPWFHKMAVDVYLLSPSHFVAFAVSMIWFGLESAILTHLSSQLLRVIEVGLVNHTPSTEILWALARRLIFVALVATFNWWCTHLHSVVKGRVTSHMELILMEANLQADLATAKDTASAMRTTADDAWRAFSEISGFVTELISFTSHLALIAHISRTSGGPLFVICCIAKPFILTIYQRSLWNKACIGFISDPNYTRMNAMQTLATESIYKQDVRAGNLAKYILNCYRKAHKQLGTTSTDHPYYSYDRFPSPWFDIIMELSGDLPIIYCALNAFLNPSMLSLSSIAILEKSSWRLSWSLERLVKEHESFKKNMNTLRELYAPPDVENKVKDGVVSYPREVSSEKGISFELKDVTFQYPGSTKTSSALKNISMDIRAGELVVIVGSNGSGKSTLVKLLARLYDPDSGSLFVDGLPASSYKMADLSEVTAILSQDNNIFPVSLGENIGLGYPHYVDNQEMITESARKGGAFEFISNYTDGFSRSLKPMVDTFSINVRGNHDHPLHEELEKLDKINELSGGEKQRLVASRTFMRFTSGRVKFVAVDEPSSALDAEGELQLFQNLLEARDGKTIIFVTHRFGHLTRYADRIICMKDGVIAESGSHVELMELKGEYAKLYDIQARTFITGENL